MKNKLLVSVFAVGIAVFAFTSCETKSNVTEVCTDLLKGSLHGNAATTGDVPSAARGFILLDEQGLHFAEYEFPSKDVNDPVLLYRSIAFGDGLNEPKRVDTLHYEYGEWEAQNTVFTLLVTPKTGDPFVLKYQGDALTGPDGIVYGGTTATNAARVEKLEKVANTFSNTDWEATFRGEFVLDSVFRDSVYWKPFPKPGKWDTIPWFDHMDTVSADTTCHHKYVFVRDLLTNANTGLYVRKEVRSEYDRVTKETKVISEKVSEYAFRWMISELATDAKFTVQLKKLEIPATEAEKLSISKYALDSLGVASEFTLDGLLYTRPVLP